MTREGPPPGVGRLPAEIWVKIFEQAEGSCDLKALRLVCHHFATLSERLLFHTILLFYRLDSWNALNELANAPHLAENVRCIEVANVTSDGRGRNFDRWKSLSDPIWQEMVDHLASRPRHGIGSTIQRTLDLVTPAPAEEDCYRRSLRLSEDLEHVFRLMQAGRAPAIDLHKFPRLIKVETVDDRDVSFIKCEDRAVPRRYYCRDREYLEIRHCQTMDLINFHMRTMMIALSQCSAPLTRLNLHSTAEIHQHPWEAQKACVSASQMPQLRHLSITPPPKGPPRQQFTFQSRTGWLPWGPPQPSSWLFSLRSLHTFEVTELLDYEPPFTVFEFLRKVHWPALRYLRLTNLHVDVDDLRTFLLVTNKQSFDHMEELIITNPVVQGGDWEALKEDLQQAVLGPIHANWRKHNMDSKDTARGPVRMVLTDAYKAPEIEAEESVETSEVQ